MSRDPAAVVHQEISCRHVGKQQDGRWRCERLVDRLRGLDMSTHPMAEIHFTVPSGEVYVRHWYHVPRVGDVVFLREPGEVDVFRGPVKDIIWEDAVHPATPYVVVRLG